MSTNKKSDDLTPKEKLYNYWLEVFKHTKDNILKAFAKKRVAEFK